MVGIGERVAAYRRRRGLSQVTLAGLVGRSESWLSQVERGRRDIDSLTVIRHLAVALDVPADALIGVDLPAPTSGAGHAATAAVRAYVDGYHQLLTAPQIPDATAEELLDRRRGAQRLLPGRPVRRSAQPLPTAAGRRRRPHPQPRRTGRSPRLRVAVRGDREDPAPDRRKPARRTRRRPRRNHGRPARRLRTRPGSRRPRSGRRPPLHRTNRSSRSTRRRHGRKPRPNPTPTPPTCSASAAPSYYWRP